MTEAHVAGSVVDNQPTYTGISHKHIGSSAEYEIGNALRIG